MPEASLQPKTPEPRLIRQLFSLFAQISGTADAEFPITVEHLKAQFDLRVDGALRTALRMLSLHGLVRFEAGQVFAVEPLPEDSPYWEQPGVHVSAHTSYAGNGTIPRGDELFLSNLERYVGGQPLFNEVEQV